MFFFSWFGVDGKNFREFVHSIISDFFSFFFHLIFFFQNKIIIVFIVIFNGQKKKSSPENVITIQSTNKQINHPFTHTRTNIQSRIIHRNDIEKINQITKKKIIIIKID